MERGKPMLLKHASRLPRVAQAGRVADVGGHDVLRTRSTLVEVMDERNGLATHNFGSQDRAGIRNSRTWSSPMGQGMNKQPIESAAPIRQGQQSRGSSKADGETIPYPA
ncbi:hypothetical protein BN1723_013811 [Verticillium longisporum]|uniref:Uncharacterized protein n=1 Tax=Verticillium longisporum TaxID=100787 RepID=A0A0G4LW78_VERLO|nr:hypothetical protein HYQ44_010047 [Verticillium longisporum]KAG7126344.1 hypothetical protein HYQ46_010491 [Verticillium longisporum]CRK26303.1 hypothetical protein BN1723_013811 [Verticillium longisporum]